MELGTMKAAKEQAQQSIAEMERKSIREKENLRKGENGEEH